MSTISQKIVVRPRVVNATPGHSEQAAAGGEPMDAQQKTVLRRRNLHLLLQRFVAAHVNAGEGALGLEQTFAAQLQISKSMLSQIKSSRAISDRLARQIEACCHEPSGWLDQLHEADVITESEQAFLDECLGAYRATNARGRRELRALVRRAAAGPSSAKQHS